MSTNGYIYHSSLATNNDACSPNPQAQECQVKITKEPGPNIYTRKVTVEMTEAEWEFITGLAAGDRGPGCGRGGARLANGSKPYWDKNLDYSRLFVSERAGIKYPFGELTSTEKVLASDGRKIDAIKEYRNRTGCSIKAAKDAVDTYLGLPVY